MDYADSTDVQQESEKFVIERARSPAPKAGALPNPKRARQRNLRDVLLRGDEFFETGVLSHSWNHELRGWHGLKSGVKPPHSKALRAKFSRLVSNFWIIRVIRAWHAVASREGG